MNNIEQKINELQKSISDIKDETYKEYFNNISSILKMMSDKIEEVAVNQENIEENLQYLDDDVSGLQDELFEEVSFEELTDMDDEYAETSCVNCGKPVFMEKSLLDSQNSIPCPFCGRDIRKK